MGAHGMENTTINVDLRLDIEGALKEKRAFDEKTAADLGGSEFGFNPGFRYYAEERFNCSHS